MKTSALLLCLIFGSFTVLSGCTKKNSKNKDSAKPAVQQQKKDGDGNPVQPPAAPSRPTEAGENNPNKGNTDLPAGSAAQAASPNPSSASSTSSPAPSTPSPAASTPVVNTNKPLPQAQPPQAQQQPQSAAQLIAFEDCFHANVKMSLTKTKDSKITKIDPEMLFDLRLGTSALCQMPEEYDDKLISRMTERTSNLAKELFPESIAGIKLFEETEVKKLTDDQRKKIYADFSRPTVVQATQPDTKKVLEDFHKCYEKTVSGFINIGKEKGKTTILPKELYDLKNYAARNCQTSPIAADENLDKTLTMKISQAALQAFAESAEGIKLFVETENKSLQASERIKIYDDFAATKEPKQEVKAEEPKKEAKKEDPKPVAAKVEEKKEDAKPVAKVDPKKEAAKPASPATAANTKVKPAATPPAAAAGAPATSATKASADATKKTDAKTASNEVVVQKDIPSYEKCLKEQSISEVAFIKSDWKEVTSPIQIFILMMRYSQKCRVNESAEAYTVLVKTVLEAVTATSPNSKPIVDFFVAVDKQESSMDEKVAIMKLYDVNIEIATEKTKINGTFDAPTSNATTASYGGIKMVGGMSISIQVGKEDAATRQIPLESLQAGKVKFSFDFTEKPNKTYTLNIAGSVIPQALDFTIVKGNVEQFKQKNPITIALTKAAWVKVLKTNLGIQLNIDPNILAKIPMKFSMEPSETKDVRTCELTMTSLNCADPDTKVKASMNKDAVLKSK